MAAEDSLLPTFESLSPAARRFYRVFAVFLAITAFCGVFGAGAVSSIEIFIGQRAAATSPLTDGELVSSVVAYTLLAAVAIGALGCFAVRFCGDRQWTAWIRGRRGPLYRWPLVIAAIVGLNLIGFWIVEAFGWPSPAQPHRPLWFALTWGILAAVSEELIVVVLPLWVVRTAYPRAMRLPWVALIIAALAAARMSYHLYQGGQAWSHLAWAIAVPILYLYVMPSVWPLVIGHALWNVVDDLQHAGALPNTVMIQAALVVALVGSALLLRDRGSASSTTRSRSGT